MQGTLSSNSSYITINDPNGAYGTIAPGDSVENYTDPYNVTVSPNTPEGTPIEFSLNVTADGGYTTSLSFTLLVGNPGVDWVTHDCGNVKFTVTRYGALGFMGSSQTEGDCFCYPITGSNLMYYGSFAVGTDSSYVVDRYYESGSDDTDWETTTTPDGTVRMYEPGPNNFDEYTTAQYDDSNHPSPMGLVCEQYSWAWDDPTANDFVIMKFILRNEGSTTLNNLYAAIFIDWDLGSMTSNEGSSDVNRNLTWMFETTPYCGVEILDPPRSTPAANLALIDHAQYVYPYSGLPDNIQIQFMDGSIQNPSSDRPYDWSTCNSAGPFTLAPGSTAVVAFAILGGDNLGDLQANADTAYNRYWNWPGVEEHRYTTTSRNFKISPVISHNRPYKLDYNFGQTTEMRVYVYDVAGRLVMDKPYKGLQGSGSVKLDFGQLSQGIYFAHIEADNQTQTVKLIWLR